MCSFTVYFAIIDNAHLWTSSKDEIFHSITCNIKLQGTYIFICVQLELRNLQYSHILQCLPDLMSEGVFWSETTPLRWCSGISDLTLCFMSSNFISGFKFGGEALMYSCFAAVRLDVTIGKMIAGVSFGGVRSFIISFDLRNSSSSSVAQVALIGTVPYLSSVVILTENIQSWSYFADTETTFFMASPHKKVKLNQRTIPIFTFGIFRWIDSLVIFDSWQNYDNNYTIVTGH